MDNLQFYGISYPPNDMEQQDQVNEDILSQADVEVEKIINELRDQDTQGGDTSDPGITHFEEAMLEDFNFNSNLSHELQQNSFFQGFSNSTISTPTDLLADTQIQTPFPTGGYQMDTQVSTQPQIISDEIVQYPIYDSGVPEVTNTPSGGQYNNVLYPHMDLNDMEVVIQSQPANSPEYEVIDVIGEEVPVNEDNMYSYSKPIASNLNVETVEYSAEPVVMTTSALYSGPSIEISKKRKRNDYTFQETELLNVDGNGNVVQYLEMPEPKAKKQKVSQPKAKTSEIPRRDKFVVLPVAGEQQVVDQPIQSIEIVQGNNEKIIIQEPFQTVRRTTITEASNNVQVFTTNIIIQEPKQRKTPQRCRKRKQTFSNVNKNLDWEEVSIEVPAKKRANRRKSTKTWDEFEKSLKNRDDATSEKMEDEPVPEMKDLDDLIKSADNSMETEIDFQIPPELMDSTQVSSLNSANGFKGFDSEEIENPNNRIQMFLEKAGTKDPETTTKTSQKNVARKMTPITKKESSKSIQEKSDKKSPGAGISRATTQITNKKPAKPVQEKSDNKKASGAGRSRVETEDKQVQTSKKPLVEKKKRFSRDRLKSSHSSYCIEGVRFMRTPGKSQGQKKSKILNEGRKISKSSKRTLFESRNLRKNSKMEEDFVVDEVIDLSEGPAMLEPIGEADEIEKIAGNSGQIQKNDAKLGKVLKNGEKLDKSKEKSGKTEDFKKTPEKAAAKKNSKVPQKDSQKNQRKDNVRKKALTMAFVAKPEKPKVKCQYCHKFFIALAVHQSKSKDCKKKKGSARLENSLALEKSLSVSLSTKSPKSAEKPTKVLRISARLEKSGSSSILERSAKLDKSLVQKTSKKPEIPKKQEVEKITETSDDKTCWNCQKKYRSVSQLIAHKKLYHEIHKCQNCGAEFESSTKYTKHYSACRRKTLVAQKANVSK